MLAPFITTTTPMEALFDHSEGDLRLGMRRSLDGDGDDKKRRLGAVGCSSNWHRSTRANSVGAGRWADREVCRPGSCFTFFVMTVYPSL